MERLEVVLAGLGGHGIIFMGRVLGYAAILSGLDAVMTTSYSPAQRGGWSKAYLVLSREPIEYPVVENADALVATTNEMLKSEIGLVKKGGIVILDSDIIKEATVDLGEYRVYRVPARTLAREACGSERPANMVLLGALLSLLKTIEPRHVEEAIEYSVRRKDMIQPNIDGFRRGYNYIAKL